MADAADGWPMKVVPVAINVIQHPLPTALRCWKLGQAIRRAANSYPEKVKIVILGTGGMSHQLNGARFGHLNTTFDNDFLDRLESDPMSLTEMTHQHIMKEAGAEAVELIMVNDHEPRWATTSARPPPLLRTYDDGHGTANARSRVAQVVQRKMRRAAPIDRPFEV